MKEFPRTFSIVDTETTGMRPPFSRIIDIGIIRVENGKEVARFESLVNPGTTLPSSITRLTSITDEELATAPPFEDIALQVQELLEGSVFVAHNASFDYALIKSEFSRLGMEFWAETLCSVRLSRALSPKSRTHNLDSVIDRYDLQLDGDRHRALPDADAVWKFMQASHAVHAPEEIAAAVARARAGGRTPRVARDTFTDLPDSAGVYFFYGPDQELLYIGKSKHVRTRARSHFQRTDSRKEERLQEETANISSVRTSGELSALLLESALIKAQSPLYNRALRKRKLLVIAHEARDESGHATLTLDRATDIDPTVGALAIFRTVAQGKASLRMLAKEHQLCHKLLGIETGAGACFAHQLGSCRGACAGKEPAEEYNERFTNAFASRRMRTWPYKGTVMIEEKETDQAGTVLFVRDWMLLGAYRYEDDAYEPLLPNLAPGFEYDTYKILVRYMLNTKNRRSIRTLSAREYETTLARMAPSTDEMAYERVIE